MLTPLIISWVVLRYTGKYIAFIADNWLDDWREIVNLRILPILGRAIGLAVLLIFPALVLALLLHLFGHWLFGLPGLILSMAALLYCCGRQDYDAMMLTEPLVGEGDVLQKAREQRAYASYDRWFSAAFWFLLLGPAGALFYRCISILAGIKKTAISDADDIGISTNTEFIACGDTQELLAWLDYLPIRVWGLCIVIVGDVDAGFKQWRKCFFKSKKAQQFLDAVSLAAVACSPETFTQENQNIRDRLLSLNDRAMWVALICLIIIVVL